MSCGIKSHIDRQGEDSPEIAAYSIIATQSAERAQDITSGAIMSAPAPASAAFLRAFALRFLYSLTGNPGLARSTLEICPLAISCLPHIQNCAGNVDVRAEHDGMAGRDDQQGGRGRRKQE